MIHIIFMYKLNNNIIIMTVIIELLCIIIKNGIA